MKHLSETQINLHAPYKVTKDQSNTLTFLTENGVLYHIGFAEDTILEISNVYQIYIENVCDIKSIMDDKVRQTIVCVLEQFFLLENHVLLYVCDVRDGRQNARSRLFQKWFSQYKKKDLYVLKSTTKVVEGTFYYASILLKKDNPNLNLVLQEFNSLIQDLDAK